MVPVLLIMLFGILSAQIVIFGFGLTLALVFGIGVVLLVGYMKHAGGNLDENKILLLWFGTLAYNGLPLFITLLLLVVRDDYRDFCVENFGACSALALCWSILATCLSLTAIYDEFICSKT